MAGIREFLRDELRRQRWKVKTGTSDRLADEEQGRAAEGPSRGEGALTGEGRPGNCRPRSSEGSPCD